MAEDEDEDVFHEDEPEGYSEEETALRNRLIISTEHKRVYHGDTLPPYSVCVYWSGKRYLSFKNEDAARRHVDVVWMRDINNVPKTQRTMGWWMDHWGNDPYPTNSVGDGICLYPVFAPMENELGEVAP